MMSKLCRRALTADIEGVVSDGVVAILCVAGDDRCDVGLAAMPIRGRAGDHNARSGAGRVAPPRQLSVAPSGGHYEKKITLSRSSRYFAGARQHLPGTMSPAVLLLLSVCLATPLAACTTETFEPRTVAGAQCKKQCSTGLSANLGGIPFVQKMNNCLSACREMDQLRMQGR